MLELEFQSDPAFLKRVWNLTEAEVLIRCPVCKAKVIFAPNWESARKHQVHPGAYCSVDRKHLTVMFELAPEPTPDLAPQHLLSTLRLVERAYPQGVPHAEYLALLFVLSDHMCEENLALAASYWREDEGSRLNDVLAAKQQEPETNAVLQKLMDAGLEAWIAEEE